MTVNKSIGPRVCHLSVFCDADSDTYVITEQVLNGEEPWRDDEPWLFPFRTANQCSQEDTKRWPVAAAAAAVAVETIDKEDEEEVAPTPSSRPSRYQAKVNYNENGHGATTTTNDSVEDVALRESCMRGEPAANPSRQSRHSKIGSICLVSQHSLQGT
jgi:hypothetical protein